MKTYYDRRAHWHDGYMGYTTTAAMEELLLPVIATLEDLFVNRKVLEIACGTGNWTQVIAKRARSVTASDSSPLALEIARDKLREFANVSLTVADAFTLHGIAGPFDIAFASDWWSHVPKSMIPTFIDCLHRKLTAEATVIMLDMSYQKALENPTSHYDQDGDRVTVRSLPDGGEFEVVRNFPSEQELRDALAGRARDIRYREFDALKRWLLTYTPVPLDHGQKS